MSFERFSTSSEARKVKTPSRSSGIYITVPVSRFSGMKSLFGKKPFTVTGRRYPAVRSAEIMSTAGIIYPNAPRPASPSAPTQRYYLLKKPQAGGLPMSPSDARVYPHMVTGISLPTPSSSSTFVFPVCIIIEPADMKSAVLIIAWKI